MSAEANLIETPYYSPWFSARNQNKVPFCVCAGVSVVRLSLMQGGRSELRRVPVPPHRFSPLKENWMKIFTPVVEHLKLQVRLNLKTKCVEIKVPRCQCYMCTFITYMYTYLMTGHA